MRQAVLIRADINGSTYIIPTYAEGNLVIDRRIQNFKEVQSQQGTLTRFPFRVPLSDIAIDAFGDLSDLTQTPKIDIRKTFAGSIVIEGRSVYSGSFQIIGIYANPKEVELIFQGNETALKSQVKDITLADLFEDETISYTASTIDNSMDFPGDDYIYSLIDYGQNFTVNGGGGTVIDDPSNPLFQTDFKPLVSLGKILSMLEEKEGITVEVDSNISDLLLQYIPLHNNSIQTPVVDTSPANNTGTLTAASQTLATINNDTGTTEYALPASTASNYNTVGFGTTNYTAQETGLHEFSFNFPFFLDVTGLSAAFFSTIQFGIKINAGTFLPLYIRTVGNSVDTNIIVSGNTSIQLTATDVVTFFFQIAQTSTDPVYTIQYDFSGIISCLSTPSFTSSTDVLIGQNFPDGMNAWDHCIKTIVNQCNGIIDRDGDTYTITAWEDWIEAGTELDLNDFIIHEQSISIEPPSTTGAKRIEFNYLDDDDFYNKSFRDQEGDNYGELIIQDTGIDLASNTVKVDIPYAPTPVAPIIGYEVPIPKFIDADFNTVKTKPRLLKRNDVSTPQRIYVANTYDPTNVFGSDPVFYLGNWEEVDGGFDTKDYNWGTTLNFFASSGFPNNTLYKRFWERFIVETYGENSRKVTLQIEMSQWQIQNLLLNEKVKFRNNTYRILRISGIDLTNPSSPVTLELALRKEVENIDIAPFYPYDVINTVVQWKDSSDNSILGDSPTPAADLEASAKAYGFFYDSVENRAIQSGQILVT